MQEQPLPRFKHELRVRYNETDAQGSVFNGNYLIYIDVSAVEYFRNLGYTFSADAHAPFDIALVKITVEYLSALVFDDLLAVHAGIVRLGNSSFDMAFRMLRHSDGIEVARAQAVYVNYDLAARRARPLPADVREAIAAWEGPALAV